MDFSGVVENVKLALILIRSIFYQVVLTIMGFFSRIDTRIKYAVLIILFFAGLYILIYWVVNWRKVYAVVT